MATWLRTPTVRDCHDPTCDSTNVDRLKDKVALITGAGRIANIGLAICEAFLRQGARAVIATDVRTDEASSILRKVEAQFGRDRFQLLAHDVTSESEWRSIVDSIVQQFGGLDVLVNNAGISIHGGIEQTSLDDLRKAMSVWA